MSSDPLRDVGVKEALASVMKAVNSDVGRLSVVPFPTGLRPSGEPSDPVRFRRRIG
jgi:hypothetical protein